MNLPFAYQFAPGGRQGRMRIYALLARGRLRRARCRIELRDCEPGFPEFGGGSF
jgi:hypothetical protein